jgi:hypothetical protein
MRPLLFFCNVVVLDVATLQAAEAQQRPKPCGTADLMA